VESVPEYVVPFEAFRALAAEHDLELQYRRNFHEIWREDGGRGSELGQLAERMGVPRGIASADTADEWEAVGLYTAFCFYKT
jgi:mRNA (guanine-N7-)-methyltransferase